MNFEQISIMNKKYFALLLFLITITSHSQIDFGFKGGVNFNSPKRAKFMGDFNHTYNAENRIGFHLGVFAEAEIPKLGIFFRPELIYTHIKSEYRNLISDDYEGLTINKIDIPVLLGTKVVGPLRLLFGPSFQFMVDSSFSLDEFQEINKDVFALNMQLGIGLKFESFDVDVRWERGLSNSESNYDTDLANGLVNFDTSSNQFILGLSYRFGK